MELNLLVPIKNEQMKLLPFKDIQSRNATAIILSYLDNRQTVLITMQKIAHITRAYIINNQGLPGFLIGKKEHLFKVLTKTYIEGEIQAKDFSHQAFNIEKLSS